MIYIVFSFELILKFMQLTALNLISVHMVIMMSAGVRGIQQNPKDKISGGPHVLIVIYIRDFH